MTNLLAYLYHHAHPFKLVFGSLKDVLSDVLIRIDKTGVLISGLDPQHVGSVMVLVHDTTNYVCESTEPILIGVHISELYHTFRGVSKESEVAMYVESDRPDTLVLRISSSDSFRVHHIKSQKLPEGTTSPLWMPNDFTASVDLPAVHLYRAVRDIGYRREHIVVFTTTDCPHLNLQVDDENGQTSSVVLIGETLKDSFGSEFDRVYPLIANKFHMRYMEKFTKTTLAKSVVVGLKQDFPLVLQYTVDDQVVIKISVAPILATEPSE